MADAQVEPHIEDSGAPMIQHDPQVVSAVDGPIPTSTSRSFFRLLAYKGDLERHRTKIRLVDIMCRRLQLISVTVSNRISHVLVAGLG